jgi:hypothetical protein
MGIISNPNTFATGATILASEHNDGFNTIYDEFSGNIDNNNIKASAGIVDTKLAQITTASKVSGTSFTGLASIPSGAGAIPAANVTDLAITSQVAGDLLRFDGSNWVRQADGTANQYLESVGDGTYTWVADVDIYDYGTSASASTAKHQKNLKIAYGTLTIAATTESTISNLPFTSATSYILTASTSEDTNDDRWPPKVTQTNGTTASLWNTNAAQYAHTWIAVGT